MPRIDLRGVQPVIDDARERQPADSDRLESWKEIALYLQRDIRTVQRWEQAEGLPVHRHQHAERGSVYAFRSEIDAWRRGRQPHDPEPIPGDARPQPAPRGKVAWSAAAAVVVLASIGVALWTREARPLPNGTAAPGLDAPRVLDELTREGARYRHIPMPHSFGTSMAVTPDDRYLYIANQEAGGVRVVDLRSLATLRVTAADRPTALVMARDGSRVFVSQYAGDVLVIDTRTGRTGRIVTGGRARDLALTADGRTLYIAAEYSGVLAADTTSGSVRQISGLVCPLNLALSPDDRFLYVAYQCNGPAGRSGHDTIDVVSTATGSSVGIIGSLTSVGSTLAVSPDGTDLWADGSDVCVAPQYDHEGCGGWHGSIVNLIRTSDRTPVAVLKPGPPGGMHTFITILRDGTRAVLGGLRIEVISTASLAPVEAANFTLSGAIALSQDGRTAFVPRLDLNEISVVSVRRDPSPLPGISGRWSGDGTANDAVGVAHASVEGSVRFAPGLIGQAFAFDAPGGEVRIGRVNRMGLLDHGWTIAAWMKVSEREPMTVMERIVGSGSRQRGWRVSLDEEGHLSACLTDGSHECGAHDPARIAGATALDPGTWYHVALVRADREARLYVDGRLEGHGGSITGLDDDRYGPVRFGSAGRVAFRGLLDEIETYERTLGDAEVAALAHRVRRDGT